MPANLAQTADGKTMFASLREVPWHRQGTVIQEEVSGAEMLKLAHMDWNVAAGPAFTMIKRKVATGWDAATDTPVYSWKEESATIPEKKAIYREDTGEVLGVVGEDYVSFQNSEMIDFFEGLVQGRKITYETAGALGNGESVWVMARIPDLSMAIKGDEIIPYMLIRTGHIGNLNLACFPTLIRVLCANTMRAASQDWAGRRAKYGKQNVHSGYKIRHTSGMHKAVKDVQVAYNKLIEDIVKTKELYEILANKEVTPQEVRSYFEKCLDTKEETEKAKEVSKAAQTRKENRLQELQKLFESPTNQTATRNTLFAAYGTVVEYVDHEKATRCTDDRKEETCRFESSMFGAGADLKDTALAEALALV